MRLPRSKYHSTSCTRYGQAEARRRYYMSLIDRPREPSTRKRVRRRRGAGARDNVRQVHGEDAT